jgi:carbamoyl-phosphate synthase large subunit
VVQREQPVGVIVQLGGQTPLKLTRPLEAAGVAILGTSPDAIDVAEDRRRFDAIARSLGIRQPENGTATSVEEAVEIAERVGYPVLVRPSYVLGGRAMEIVYDADSLREYFARAVRVSEERPVLIDRFLEDAFEADVDAVCDGERVVIGGVMQHIEDAGIHSGDSACVLPPYLIAERDLETMRAHTAALARALNVVGLINVQYAVKDGTVYVLEVNPRASRTIPFVSKAIGVPLASIAARVMTGESLAAIGFTEEVRPAYVSVKEAVFPFKKFREFDPILGPEMRSTGEVMHEGRPHAIDLVVNGEVQLLINTPLGKHAQRDDYTIRQAAIAHRVPYTTTLSAASAACDAVLSLRSRQPAVRSLQEWHELLRESYV